MNPTSTSQLHSLADYLVHEHRWEHQALAIVAAW